MAIKQTNRYKVEFIFVSQTRYLFINKYKKKIHLSKLMLQNERLEISRKTHYISIFNFLFLKSVFFFREVIVNIPGSISPQYQTPRSSSKIHRCASYIQLSCRCYCRIDKTVNT